MTKYIIDKGFCFGVKLGTRKKGSIIELSGKELEFAQDNKCVSKFKEEKEVKK
jgi:hypothetical protein